MAWRKKETDTWFFFLISVHSMSSVEKTKRCRKNKTLYKATQSVPTVTTVTTVTIICYMYCKWHCKWHKKAFCSDLMHKILCIKSEQNASIYFC
jgi:hypothetical protein